MKDQIDRSQDKVTSFNERDVLFKLMPTDYSEIKEISDKFEPYLKLWQLVSEYELDKYDWQNGSFLKLNFITIDKKLNYLIRTNEILKEKFETEKNLQAVSICEKFLRSLDDFRSQAWLIQYLTIEVMVKKLNHWNELFNLCNIETQDFIHNISLSYLVELGFLSH